MQRNEFTFISKIHSVVHNISLDVSIWKVIIKIISNSHNILQNYLLLNWFWNNSSSSEVDGCSNNNHHYLLSITLEQPPFQRDGCLFYFPMTFLLSQFPKCANNFLPMSYQLLLVFNDSSLTPPPRNFHTPSSSSDIAQYQFIPL